MAKRRHKSEQELPFVALMDTMTNVVGVLTIVLVMIGISLSSAVNKVLSELPPASIEQVRAVEEALAKLLALQKTSQASLDRLPKPDANSSATIQAEILALEKKIKDKGIQIYDTQTLARELTKRSADLQKQKEEIARLIAERDRLIALLMATPAPVKAKPKVVRMPSSRPIPKDSIIEIFLVGKDQLYYADTLAVETAVLRDLDTPSGRATELRRTKNGNKIRILYDQNKVVAHFASRRLQTRYLSIEIPFRKPWPNPFARIVAIPGAGETIQQFSAFNSYFQNTLRRIRSKPQSVVLFRVLPEGFETYLAAREICDQANVPAGWDIASELVHGHKLNTVVWNQLEKPPVNPAKPAKPTDIKPPGQTLD